uniref:Uncharacterized protein n=1 Tax=Candidatus Kentrum sp. FW TaxID=2126338 RepID=A0A450SUM0_9GAMM|nr:MAG: hypothetical protein BECKFW1821A_GA0114235_107310 [Candidatus Kentron sp. FW]
MPLTIRPIITHMYGFSGVLGAPIASSAVKTGNSRPFYLTVMKVSRHPVKQQP